MRRARTGPLRAAFAAATGLAFASVAGAVRGPGIAEAAACDLARITWPTAGTTVAGDVPIYGSAAVDGFQFYKLEYAAAAAPERWSATSDVVRASARHVRLDRWSSGAVPDGAYRLKLTVVDTNAQERCRVIVEGIAVANARALPTGPAPDRQAAGAALDAGAAPWPTAAAGRAVQQADDAPTASAAQASPTVVQRAAAAEPVTATSGLTATGGLTDSGVTSATITTPANTSGGATAGTAADEAAVDEGASDAGGAGAIAARFGSAFAIGFAAVAVAMLALRRRLFKGAGDDAAPRE